MEDFINETLVSNHRNAIWGVPSAEIIEAVRNKQTDALTFKIYRYEYRDDLANLVSSETRSLCS
jgi:hypothetical protein